MNIDETFEDQCFLLNIRIPLVLLTGAQFLGQNWLCQGSRDAHRVSMFCRIPWLMPSHHSNQMQENL